jgi:hypothetical protein
MRFSLNAKENDIFHDALRFGKFATSASAAKAQP